MAIREVKKKKRKNDNPKWKGEKVFNKCFIISYLDLICLSVMNDSQ